MEILLERAKCLQIDLTQQQMMQFQVYYEMLIEKNKVMNLTAITEFDEVVTKHFIDSLALGAVNPEIKDPGKPVTMLDLGTGAGFPGIPLKIAFPHLEMTLMDSLKKRVHFLQSVLDKLELSGIHAVHGRAEEEARRKEYRANFDICVSRAVANLSTLSEYCLPFVKTGGYFISYKASEMDEELKNAKRAIQILGGKQTDVRKITLPDSDIERSFVFIKKIKATPDAYPRKAGTAGRNPLS